ncbi:MAG: hemerythrin domain-containing protein [Candidatus Scalindua sp.]
MSKLVDELKNDHSILSETLKKVKSLGISSAEGQKTLLATKSGLLAHLLKEDEHLYPVLYKAAESDANLKQTLDFFAKDMDVISKIALGFFDKYSEGGSGLEFAEDCGQFFATFSQRLRKEEDIIYVEYDKLEQ